MYHIRSQKHLSAKHAKSVNFLQKFSFILKHKPSAENRVANALSRRMTLLSILTVTTIGLDSIKSEYVNDDKLSRILTALASGKNLDYPNYSLKYGFFSTTIGCVYRLQVFRSL